MHIVIGRGIILGPGNCLEFGQTRERVREQMGPPLLVCDEIGDGSEESWSYTTLRLDFDLTYSEPRLTNIEVDGREVSQINGHCLESKSKAEISKILDEVTKQLARSEPMAVEIASSKDEIKLSYEEQLSLTAWFDPNTNLLSSVSFGCLFADPDTEILPTDPVATIVNDPQVRAPVEGGVANPGGLASQVLAMSNNPPTVRTDFVSDWDKCVYLLEQLTYWFWETDETKQVTSYTLQLEEILNVVDPHGATQRGAEAWALIAATRDDWQRCLVAKRHEVDVIRHLLAERVDPRIVTGHDLVVAAEEYLIFTREAGEDALGVDLISEVLRDGILGAVESELLTNLIGNSSKRPRADVPRNSTVDSGLFAGGISTSSGGGKVTLTHTQPRVLKARSVRPLEKEGGAFWYGIAETDDGPKFVKMPFESRGGGPESSWREYIALHLARSIGLPALEPAVVAIDPSLVDEEWRSKTQWDPPNYFMGTPLQRGLQEGSGPGGYDSLSEDEKALLYVFDNFLYNADRADPEISERQDCRVAENGSVILFDWDIYGAPTATDVGVPRYTWKHSAFLVAQICPHQIARAAERVVTAIDEPQIRQTVRRAAAAWGKRVPEVKLIEWLLCRRTSLQKAIAQKEPPWQPVTIQGCG